MMELINLVNPFSWLEKFLEWRKRPLPIIRFKYALNPINENNHCHLRSNMDYYNTNSWFFRIGVDNDGKTSIKNADVRVEKIERIFPTERVIITNSPFFLHWANENTDNSRMIYPKTPVYIDMIYTVEGKTLVYLFHKSKHIGAGIKTTLVPGKYEITIKLLAENISPVERKILVESNGDWYGVKMGLIQENYCRHL